MAELSIKPRLSYIVETFRRKQSSLRSFGANDADTCDYFNWIMNRLSEGEDFPDIADPSAWGLSKEHRDWKLAANALTYSARDVYNLFQRSAYVDVLAALKYYGWDK